jgi:hypothetical protein
MFQQRVRDLVAICKTASALDPRKSLPFRVKILGTGRAGLWALLAAPAADSVIADGCGLNVSDDQAFLEADLFCPGLRAIGGFEGGPMLAAGHSLLLYNLGAGFPNDGIRAAYGAAGAPGALHIGQRELTDEAVLRVLSR